MDVLKVSKNSNAASVAGAIAGVIREKEKTELHAIGAAAINQTMKAIAIARGFVTPSGIDLVCIPSFSETKMLEGKERTVMKFVVERR